MFGRCAPPAFMLAANDTTWASFCMPCPSRSWNHHISARAVYGRIEGFPAILHPCGAPFATLGKTNPIGKRGRMTHTAPQPADQPVFKNAAYTQEYIDIAGSLDGDIPGRRAARSYMRLLHGHRAPSRGGPPASCRSSIRSPHLRQVMREVVETTHRILCKVMQHYLDDAEYRKLLRLRPAPGRAHLGPARLRRAAALRPLRHLPERERPATCAFCEFNGDGSSGMNENREITHSVEEYGHL